MGELEFLQAVLSRTLSGGVCLDDIPYSSSNEKEEYAKKCEAGGLIIRERNSFGQPKKQIWYSGTDGEKSTRSTRGSDQFYAVNMARVKSRIDELRKGA